MGPSIGSKFLGVCAVVACAPLCLLFGLAAALFAASEIFNGFIPTRWFSTSVVDWIFGTGSQGSARNYFGFMLSAIPASLCGAGAKWGLDQVKATSDWTLSDFVVVLWTIWITASWIRDWLEANVHCQTKWLISLFTFGSSNSQNLLLTALTL